MATNPEPVIDPKELDRPWRKYASLAVGSFVLVGVLFGFLILPAFQRENAGLDLFTAFCRSLGITAGSPAYRQPISTAQAQPVSKVSWGPEVMNILTDADLRRGAQLAGAVCTACHGENGVSATPDLPSLNGQTPQAIYKQLHDYMSGARFHPQMTPVVQQLNLQDLASLAAYYGQSAEYGGLGARGQSADLAIVRLATEGDPSRRIPACNSCHVNGSGGPPETPILTGQHHDYLANQLRLYRSGDRRNDVYRRMREISVRLTDAEIEALSRYYQGVY